MGSYQAKPLEVTRKWYVVDADGKTLGRLAARIASVLRGKHKPTFTPNVDTGDHVVVINAGKIHLTGGKLKTKLYRLHTGWPGGLKSTTAEHMHKKNPTALVETAIKGMLPKNPLGRAMFKKLKVYAGSEHQHAAQQPKPLEI